MNSTDRSPRNGSDTGLDAIADELIRKARPAIARDLALIRRPDAAVGVTQSPLGPLMIAEGPRGLVMIHYMWSGHIDEAIEMLRAKFDPIQDARAIERVVPEIKRLLEGDTNALTMKVDLSLVSSRFRLNALKHLLDVPPGAVVTYQSLAAVSGVPNAQRAIGSAMATNPIPIYVPCHRVVRSDGSVGWYGGGPSRKLQLLRAEGFEIDSHNRITPHAVLGQRDTRIYCRPECHAAKRASRLKTVIFADGAHARRAGMRPCKLCRPSEARPGKVERV